MAYYVKGWGWGEPLLPKKIEHLRVTWFSKASNVIKSMKILIIVLGILVHVTIVVLDALYHPASILILSRLHQPNVQA